MPEPHSDSAAVGCSLVIGAEDRKFRVVGCAAPGSHPKNSGGSSSRGAKITAFGHDNLGGCDEAELEKLLLGTIRSRLSEVLQKLAAMGYAAEQAAGAIIGCGFRAFPCLADAALLKLGLIKQEGDHGEEEQQENYQREHGQQCPVDAKSVLRDMVSAVRDDRSFLTPADAMRCLLVSELDVQAALTVEIHASCSSSDPGTKILPTSSTVSSSERCGETEEEETSSAAAENVENFMCTEHSLTLVSQTSSGKVTCTDYTRLSPASEGGEIEKTSEGDTSRCPGPDHAKLSSASKGDHEESTCSVPDYNKLSSASEGAEPTCMVSDAASETGDRPAEKDQLIKQLTEEVVGLRAEVEERTEWARSKVQQAAERLSKDVAELRKLRAEREETERSKESSAKRLSDLEAALRKTAGQLDQSRAVLRKLDLSNAEVRAELEAAKLSAAETVEVAKIERRALRKEQTWEKQRRKMQEELSAERRKVADAQQQLALAKERQQQAEERNRQESKAKEEAISRAESEKLAREQSEASARRRAESMQRESEADINSYREEIYRLEKKVDRLRSGTATAFSAVWASSGFANAPVPEREFQVYETAAAEWQESGVRRDRECVMCLCEEMSVVFLPCAHQVICIKCNELHQKQGMNECPSCRSRIQQRIKVYGATS